jgi:hypothetical protein
MSSRLPSLKPHLLRLTLVGACAAALSAAAPARACSVCGCGDPLLTASDPAAITGTLRLQLDVESLRVDAGNEADPALTDRLSQTSYRLNVVYRPVEALSLTATLPFVTKRIETVGGAAKVKASDLTGLGDAELAARWAVWRSVNVGAQRVHELAITGGSALPTGQKDRKDADGALIDPHGQLGTGGFGPFAGLAYRYEQGDLTALASLSYRLRTEASYFDGTKYRFGDATLFGVHGQYRVASRVALDLGVDGRVARDDRATDEAGVVEAHVVNTGGTVLAAAPGVYVDAVGGLWLFARGQVPFLKRLHGDQDVLPSFTLGLQYQLP